MARLNIKTSSTSSLKWFSNVAKSLGYTSKNIVESMMPSTLEFAGNTASDVTEIAHDLSRMKTEGRRLTQIFNVSAQLDIGRTALKNAIADIKSGKIYNKERQEALEDQDVNFDFDLGESGENSSNPSRITIKNVQPPMTRNSPLVQAVEQQTEATYRSAQITNENNVRLASTQIMMDHKNTHRTLIGLQSINDNLAMLVQFNSDSMSKHVVASLKYYEESLGLLNKTLEEVKRTSGGSGPNPLQREDNPLDSVLLSGGGLNVKGYLSAVRKNFKNQMEANPLLAPLKMMFDDTDTLKFLAASPLSFISTKIATAIIPQFLQQTMKNFDKSFSAFFPAMFMRINKMTMGSSNPILQTLGEIFGLNVKSKSAVDLSKYNKGPIPFDGMTKAAITDVIPTYLRKILAAITGQQELGFDYDQFKFKSMKELQENFNSRKNMAATLPYYDAMDSIRNRSKAVVSMDDREQGEFFKEMEKFFVNLQQHEGLVNPRIRQKNGVDTDDLRNVHDFGGNEGFLKLFRNLVLTSPKEMQMRIFGKNALESRRAVRDFLLQAEENPIKYNANHLFSGLTHDQHLQKGSNGKFEVKKGFGIGNPVDKFDLSTLDYLRDIKRILLTGIRVFPMGGYGGSKSGRRNRGGSPTSFLPNYDTELQGMERQQNAQSQNTIAAESRNVRPFTENDHNRMLRRGQMPVESFKDIGRMGDEEVQRMLLNHDRTSSESGAAKKGSLGAWIGKFLKGNTQDRYNLIRERINNLLEKPAKLLKTVFDKVDSTMYDLVFGRSDKKGESSFFEQTFAQLRLSLSKFGKSLNDKIINPIKDSLFGKEGLLTKLKASDFYKSLTSRMSSFGNYLFGVKSVDGKREGGLFSDSANEVKDVFSSFKYYFTGKAYTNTKGVKYEDNPDSVLGETKKIFSGFKSTMKQYLFGTKNEKGEVTQKGVFSSITDGFKEGVRNFKSAIFGPDSVKGKNADEVLKGMTDTIKQRAPKALAWGAIGGAGGLLLGGKLGLLGSLFLPGGPIGGAIVGTTLGFLSQSDKFKNWVFGAKDSSGERVGGVISKSTQNFFKKHRVAIIGGATLGAVKSMLGIGLLPSFLMPGGIIGGAMMGVGVSLLTRSEKFKKFMFGEEDESGKRVGGVVQKLFGENATLKKLIPNVAVGTVGGAGIGLVASKLGILGSMLVPGGPIGGAIIGAAAGIALSSEKWKKSLFGEFDEDTGLRRGGLFGKFQNWFKLEVMAPLKHRFKEINLNIKEWFTKSIANPFVDALAPMKEQMKRTVDNVKEMFQAGWDKVTTVISDVFEKHVAKPFGEFMEEKVMKPLKGFLNMIVRGIGRVFGGLLSAPFKIFNNMAQGFRSKHEQQGIQSMRDHAFGVIGDRQGRQERGERMGLFSTKDNQGNVVGKGFLGWLRRAYFDKDANQAARFGPNGAHYAPEEDARIAERNAKQDEHFQSERAKLDAEKKRLNMFRKLGLKYDYDNFDANGNDISRIYEGIANARAKIKGGRKLDSLNDEMFENLAGFSLSSIFGKQTTIAGMNPEDRAKMMDIMNGKLSGSKLKKFIMGKFSLTNQLESGTSPIALGPGAENKEEQTKVQQPESVVEAIKEESPKAIIKDALVPEVQKSNNFLDDILSVLKDKFGGSNSKTQTASSSTVELLSGNKTDTTEPPKNQEKPLSQIGFVPTTMHTEQQKEPKNQMGQIGFVPNAAGSHGINHGGNSLPGSKGTLLERIAGDVRTIAMSVHGQLDGVGSNVYKIRKMMQKSLGDMNIDETGSANKDRVGFFGKLRRIFFKPFESIRDKFMQGVHFVTDKIIGFGKRVKDVVTSILSIPGRIVKGMWDFTKKVGHVIEQTALSLAALPAKVVDIVAAGADAFVQTLKIIGPSISKTLLGAASMVGGILEGVGHTISGFGKGLGELLVNVGKGVGNFLHGIGDVAAKLTLRLGTTFLNIGEMVGDFTLKTTKTILDFTLDTVQKVGEHLKTIGTTLMEIVTSPLKFLASKLGNFIGPREVFVKGGTLDSIKAIEIVKTVEVVNNVAKVTEPVHIDLTGIEKIIKKLSPFHVVMDGGVPAAQTNTAGLHLGGHKKGKSSSLFGGLLTNSFFNALRESDAAEEKQQKIALNDSKTATNMIGERDKAAREKFLESNESKQTSLLEKIANATTAQHKDWLDIFGNKGLLTLGLLTALPFIKDLFKNLPDFLKKVGNFSDQVFHLGEKDDSTRVAYDENGNPYHVKNEHYREGLVENGLRVTNRLYKKHVAPLVRTGVKVTKGATSTVRKASSAVRKFFNAGDAAKGGTEISSEAKNVIENTVKDVGDKKSASVMSKIVELFKQFFKAGPVEKALGKDSAEGASKAVIGAVKKLFTKDILTMVLPRLIKGLVKTGVKIGAGALTGGIATAVFVGWDLSTGAAEAARYFRVSSDAVTGGMRVASAITKAMLGFFPIFSTIADIFSELSGFDFDQFVANLIYKSIASSDAYDKAEQAENDFEQSRVQYNEEHGTNLSKSAWNDMNNRTALQQVGHGISSATKAVGHGIAAGAKATWNGIKAVGHGIAVGAKATWNGIKAVGHGIVTGVKAVGHGIAAGAEAIGHGAKFLGGKIAQGAKAIWNSKLGPGSIIKGFTDDDTIKSNFHVTGNGKITTGMRLSSGAGQLIQSASLGLIHSDSVTKTIYGVGVLVQKFLSDVSDGINTHIIQPVSALWQTVSKFLGDNFTKISDFTKNIWNSVTDKVSETWDTVKATITGVGEKIGKKVGLIWDDITGKVSDIWGNVKDTVASVGDSIGSAVSDSWNTITTSIGNVWSSITDTVSSKIKNIVSDAEKGFEKIAAPIRDTWANIKDIVGDKMKDIQEVFKKVVGFIVKPVEGIVDTGKKVYNGAKSVVTSVFDKPSKSVTNAANSSLNNLGFDTGGNGPGGFGDAPGKVNGFTYYSQNDPNWKDYEYDHSQGQGHDAHPTIGYRGCGPTSMAMVVSQLTGKRYEPPQMADLARVGGFSTEDGTTWAYFDAMSNMFNLRESKFDPTTNEGREALISSLKNNQPVILSGRKSDASDSSSPFTTAGHFVVGVGMNGNKILINDPRGAQYSKAYDMDVISRDSRAGWSFSSKGDNSTIPQPRSGSAGTVTGNKALTYLDIFSKFSDAVGNFATDVFMGTSTPINWGDTDSSSDSNSSGLNMVPKNLRDAILRKTTELTMQDESGGNYFYARNDKNGSTGQAIAPSVGVLQWHGNNAKELMEKIYAQLPDNSQAKYYATQVDWNNNNPWTSSAQSALESFLKANSKVVQQVENDMAIDYVKNTNLDPVYKYGWDTGKLKDPRSVAFLADFANTGPGLVKSFLDGFQPSQVGDAFENFYDQFKTKSYWGQHPIYSSRMQKDYDSLKNWDPAQAGGFGELSASVSNRIQQRMSTKGKVSTSGARQISTDAGDYTDSYRSLKQSTSQQNNQNTEKLLQKAVDVLTAIAGHARDTSKGVKDLYDKDPTLHVVDKDGNKTNVIVVDNSSNNQNSNVITSAQQASKSKDNSDYEVARALASSRKK